MEASKYQLDIYNTVKETDKNIVINATAGSGKTTCLVEILKLLPKDKKVLFLAFNKSIVYELKERIPEWVECSTLHSMGMRTIQYFYKQKLKVDKNKNLKFTDPYLEQNLSKEKKLNKLFTINDILNLGRLTLNDFSKEGIEKLCDIYGIAPMNGEVETSIQVYQDLYDYNKSKKNLDGSRIIDFNDMIVIPATDKRVSPKKYDIILVDELQDLNNAQHAFIDKLLNKSGRFIGVGDENQAIYSFAGANVETFKNLHEKYNAVQLPLNICYRCGKNIVENAKQVVERIEPFESSLLGKVRVGKLDEVNQKDMLICRNVRPLINVYYEFIKEGKKATIKGKEIERGLINTLNKLGDVDKFEGLTKLYEQLEYIEHELEIKGIQSPKDHKRYINFNEKIEVIQTISENFSYIWEIKKELENIFSEDKEAIQMMTIHKAKGLQSDRVFYLEKWDNKKLIPSKYAETEQDFEQEKNLKFVALTRAISELIYLRL